MTVAPPVDTISISSPPSLLYDPTPEQTNTQALLLPHQALFASPILQILREHYESYGKIAHWAPVRAFGRVIIVWEEVDGADRAKRDGDFLKLDVDLPAEQPRANEVQDDAMEGTLRDSTMTGQTQDPSYKTRRRKRNSRGPMKG